MANLEERFDWLKEILDEEPQRFADYYKDNIANFLEIEEIESGDLEDLLNGKYQDFTECQSKENVREFVDKITSYIVMKAQIEEIVADYLA